MDFEKFDRVNVIDLAYQIIALHEKASRLAEVEAELEHYRNAYFDALNSSINHNVGMVGMILSAAIDPNSVINKGHQKLREEEMESKA